MMESYGSIAPQPARRAAPLALFAASSLALTLAGGATLRSALLVEQRTASCPGCKNTATGDLCAPCTLDGDCASADLPAVQGYDVVSFHSLQSGECGAAGSPAITASYGGYVWRFGSEANRDAFRDDPAKYAPKYGGFCALGVAAEDAWSREMLGPPIALASADYCGTAWALVGGALYLFNANAQPAWAPEADIAAADARWAEWFGDGPAPVNTDAYAMRKGECVASAAGNCCSCDAALGYDCPLSLLGADADAHGCLASKGYAWCASSGTCERAFEGGCESAPSSRARARGASAHYGM